jgi:pilus assembly protein Flp/PilA
MSDLRLRAAAAAKGRVGGWKKTTVAAMRRRAADRGQTAVEYLGIIAVVVAIVLAIIGTDLGQTIFDAIRAKIAELT